GGARPREEGGGRGRQEGRASRQGLGGREAQAGARAGEGQGSGSAGQGRREAQGCRSRRQEEARQEGLFETHQEEEVGAQRWPDSRAPICSPMPRRTAPSTSAS